ncbi:hypothetical protein G6F56_011870 [Rhizopus delemar]|nr:hypothetical protein G6F56_011870 [Rhizopus delemar]
MFVTTKHSIEKARRFPEVVVIDTTYKMNLNQMPVVNIVGVDNISSEYGSSSLKTFFIATVIVSDEKTITFDWILKILRNEIWSEENMPGVFVTNDDKALGRSLENIFLEVPRTLCAWPIRMNFKAKVTTAFAEEENRVTFLTNCVNPLIWCTDRNEFDETVILYRSECEKAKSKEKENELKLYLEM